MKRRSLLAYIPAATALLTVRSHGAPIPKERTTSAGFSTTVQCWSFKMFPLFEALKMSADAGANGVELYFGQQIGGDGILKNRKLGADLTDEEIALLLAELEKNQMASINLGVVPIPKDEAEARKIFEFAKKMGLYGITTESIEAIDTLEKLAKEYDLKICFHNHPKPTKLWNPETISKALEGRHANLGFCADLGHWATSGLNPLDVIKKVAPRVHAFHMKDREVIGAISHDRPFGTGVIDLVSILDEVRKHGFAGNVSIEYEHNWKTNLPEIAQCVGYLRAYSKFPTK